MEAFKTLIGRSAQMESLVRSARMVAGTTAAVLIKGETGTGKELLANAIQASSPRSCKPYLVINCAALPEGIAESELFGHRKGAFSGADSNHKGRLTAAHGGTVFLDEIDSLPLAIQAKLLRFLETGECQPVGETVNHKVDVRIIAATNSDLHEKVANGQFRKDLYFRLNVVPLELPSLSDRGSDAKMLALHFSNMIAKGHGLIALSFSKTALQALEAYHWPGNVRELRNLCERLSILMPGRVIEPENLPLELKRNQPLQEGCIHLPACGIKLENVEIDLIHQALERTHGNKSKSARLLGISRDTLLYRMRKYAMR
ncbi:MAG: sigma-54-dependent Fis family transcriptional regulator [Gammaproteobacteria bacterium]|nr:MAG: sigma-54-dependent Fis family transcriptional regulator [Gammaproteobacteria bacterium]